MIELCSLYSGSSGNCIYVGNDTTSILVDAGVSGCSIINGLTNIDVNPTNVSAVLITHEHSDHIRAAGIISRKLGIPIYANWKTWEAMNGMLGKVAACNVKVIDDTAIFNIGSLEIKPFSIPHDAAQPVGYSFHSGNRKASIATDIGHMSDTLLGEIYGSDVVLLESNHDKEMLIAGSYPYFLKKRILGDHGHLCNDDAAETMACLIHKGTTRFIMGHLSRENNCPDLVYVTAKSVLAGKMIDIDKDICFSIAERDKTGLPVKVV